MLRIGPWVVARRRYVERAERWAREAREFDDAMGDVDNDGRDARSPEGDDYNEMFGWLSAIGRCLERM